jgi:hypothetical protein
MVNISRYCTFFYGKFKMRTGGFPGRKTEKMDFIRCFPD